MINGIGKKLTLAFGVVALTIGGVAFLVHSKTEEVKASIRELTEKGWATSDASMKIRAAMLEEMAAIESYHRRKDHATIQNYEQARSTIADAIQILHGTQLLDPAELDSTVALEHQFHVLGGRMFQLADQLGELHAGQHARLFRELTQLHQQTMDSLDAIRFCMIGLQSKLEQRASELVYERQMASNRAIIQMKVFQTGSFVMSIAVTILVWLFAEWKISRPLRRLSVEVIGIGSGDLSKRIQVKSSDEVRLLEESFNRMLDDLEKNTRKRRDLEIELMQEHKLAAVGQFVQGIVHNLNNPLGVVMLASSGVSNEGDTSIIMSLIHEAARKMKSIIDTLLHKSREEQTKESQAIDLNRLILEELSFLEADLEFKHNIKREYVPARELPLVQGVYADFSQSIANIVRNAIDAMHQSTTKKLSVATRFDEQNVFVDINDTGCGIPEGNIPKIFDPFFTTKPVKGQEKEGEPTGTGLGLSSCYQLLRPYGATITVKSKLGEGSTFTLRIPYQPKPGAAKTVDDGELK